MKPGARMGRQVARLLRVSCCVLVLGACQADPWYKGRSSADWIAEMRAGDAERREVAALALGHVLAINPKLARPITALVAALEELSLRANGGTPPAQIKRFGSSVAFLSLSAASVSAPQQLSLRISDV